MAGDWIKVEKATATKPEVLRIAARLGIHPDEAFGACVRFWGWCDDHLSDGNAMGVTETLIDSVLSRQGFASALLEVDWLQVRSGSLVIPHFARHLSESAKKRALTKQRVATFKRKHRNKHGNARSVTSSSLLFSDSDLDSELIPKELRTKEFIETWNSWVAHRSEISKPLKKTQVGAQLKMLASLGIDRATTMIAHTIEKGWQGLREPEHEKRLKHGPGQVHESDSRKQIGKL